MHNKGNILAFIKNKFSFLAAVIFFLTAVLGCSKTGLPPEPVSTTVPLVITTAPVVTECPTGPVPTVIPQVTPEPEDRTKELFSALWEEFLEQYQEYGALYDRGLIDGQKVFESGSFPAIKQAGHCWNESCLQFSDNLRQLERERLETTDSLHYECMERYFSVRNTIGKTGIRKGYCSIPLQAVLLLWAFPIENEEDLERFYDTVLDLRRFFEDAIQEGVRYPAEEIESLKAEAPGVILSAFGDKLSLMKNGQNVTGEDVAYVAEILQDGLQALDGFSAAKGQAEWQGEGAEPLPAVLAWKACAMDEPEDYLALLENSLQELLVIYYSLGEQNVTQLSSGDFCEGGIQEAESGQEEAMESDESVTQFPSNSVMAGPVLETTDLPRLFYDLSPGTVQYVTGRLYPRLQECLQGTEAYGLLFSRNDGKEEVFFSLLPGYYEGVITYLTEWVLISNVREDMPEQYRTFIDRLVLEAILPSITDILVLHNGMDEAALEKYLDSQGLGGLGLSGSLYEHSQCCPLRDMPSALGYACFSTLMQELSSIMEERFREEETIHYLCGLGPLYWDQLTEAAFDWAEKTMAGG